MVAQPANHYQHQRREALKQKTDKLLAEWFWIDRWMGSSAFLLPLEPRGLYREMLTQAWRRGAALPNDHAAIQNATGCKPAEWRRCWPLIEKYWLVDGERLVNETQVEVYAEAKALQLAASERGKKGAKARALAKLKQRLGVTQAPPENKPPSLSPQRTQSNEHARVVPTNALVTGRRPELESEALRLAREIAAAEGHPDGEEIMRQASHYEGAATSKLNPASMSDDRLLNTVLDLREWKRQVDAKAATA